MRSRCARTCRDYLRARARLAHRENIARAVVLRERYSQERPYAVGDRGRGTPEHDLPRSGEPGTAAVEERGEEAAGAKRRGTEGNTGADRARALKEEERRHREDCTEGKKRERSGRRGQRIPAELLRVDAELLARERIERGLLIAHQLGGHPLGVRLL